MSCAITQHNDHRFGVQKAGTSIQLIVPNEHAQEDVIQHVCIDPVNQNCLGFVAITLSQPANHTLMEQTSS